MRTLVPSFRKILFGFLTLWVVGVAIADQPPEIAGVTYPQSLIVNGGVNNSEILANATICDAAGNTYVTGSFMGSATFGTNVLSSSGGFGFDDAYVVKYDPAGNVLWARRAGGSGKDYGRAITLDGSGGIYVTGTSDSQPFNYGTGSFYCFGKTMFLIRYDGSGNVLWVQHGGTTGLPGGTMTINSIARDSAANVIVAGSFNGRVIITGNPGSVTLTNKDLITPTAAEDFFLAKYDPAGALLWAINPGSTNTEFISSVAIDSANAVYAAGGYSLSTEIGGQTYTNLNAGVLLTKFSSAGDLLWSSNLSDATNSNPGRAWSVVVDAADRITLSLQGDNSSKPFNFRGNSFALAFGSISLLAQFDAAGNLFWMKQLPFQGGASSLARDQQNNLYSGSSLGFVDSTVSPLSLSILKFNSAGAALWTNTIPKTAITFFGLSAISLDDSNIAHVVTTLNGSAGLSLAVGWTNIFPFIGQGYNQLLFTIASNYVAVLPNFVQQPTNMTFQPPVGLTNSAQARAWPVPKYYWYMNGLKLGSQTNFILGLGPTGFTNVTTYYVVASNSVGMSTSSVVTAEANLRFLTSPATNIAVMVNTTLAIPASATGTTAIAYQWRLNGTNVPNATNATLALPNITTNQAGSYTLVLSNSLAKLTSAPPSIVTVVLPGYVDPAFATNFLTGCLDLLRDRDGGFYLARGSVSHMNVNSTIDPAGPWAGGTGVNIWTLLRESDTQFLVGGAFAGGITRYNTNGTIDATFSTGTGPTNTVDGPSFSYVESMLRLSNGQYLVAGSFNKFAGQSWTNLARLNTNGSLDTTFPAHAFKLTAGGNSPGIVHRIALQADGKILVGGELTVCDGLSVSNLVRLNPDGTLDPTFSASGILRPFSGGRVHALLPLADGKILVGGSWSNPTNSGIVRLNTDGSLDPTFSGVAQTAPTHALALVQNKLIAGGQNFIKRMTYDGVLDPTFSTGSYFNSSQTEVMILEPSGNLMTGGSIGVRRIWLEPMPIVLPNFSEGSGMAMVNGQFQLSACGGVDGQTILIQASTDLMTWSTIGTNIVSGGCISFTDSQSQAFASRYYRLTLP